MKLAILAAGLISAAAIPGIASAQVDPGCLRSNQNSNTQGTVLGAAGGALAGSALAGSHNRGLGAVLGAVGGGVIGNRLANSRNDACPEGYYRDPNYRPAYNAQPAYGAPPAYQDRDRAYGDRDRAYGDRDRDRDYVAGSSYGYGRDFWQGAPRTSWERVQWLQQRIDRNRADGSLSPREAYRVQRELDKTRAYARRSRQRYGELRPEDQTYIEQRLDYVSRSIRWARRNG